MRPTQLKSFGDFTAIEPTGTRSYRYWEELAIQAESEDRFEDAARYWEKARGDFTNSARYRRCGRFAERDLDVG